MKANDDRRHHHSQANHRYRYNLSSPRSRSAYSFMTTSSTTASITFMWTCSWSSLMMYPTMDDHSNTNMYRMNQVSILRLIFVNWWWKVSWCNRFVDEQMWYICIAMYSVTHQLDIAWLVVSDAVFHVDRLTSRSGSIDSRNRTACFDQTINQNDGSKQMQTQSEWWMSEWVSEWVSMWTDERVVCDRSTAGNNWRLNFESFTNEHSFFSCVAHRVSEEVTNERTALTCLNDEVIRHQPALS